MICENLRVEPLSSLVRISRDGSIDLFFDFFDSHVGKRRMAVLRHLLVREEEFL
jgi:hypothetical protein